MKRDSLFLLFLLALSAVAGYLLSKASLVGRVGISLFYRQYGFLKIWWQGGLLIFLAWMTLFLLQGRAQEKWRPAIARRLQLSAIVLALVGLFFTWQDFRYNTAHRWLGQRFHWGVYFFWLGWIGISLYHLARKKKEVLPPG